MELNGRGEGGRPRVEKVVSMELAEKMGTKASKICCLDAAKEDTRW